MVTVKILLPLVLLGLKTAMKLYVCRKPEVKHYFELLYELPNDIVFLSLSYSFVYIFLDIEKSQETIIVPLVIIFISIIVFAICRTSRFLSEGSIKGWKIFQLILLVIISYVISLLSVDYTATRLITAKENLKTEQKKIL